MRMAGMIPWVHASRRACPALMGSPRGDRTEVLLEQFAVEGGELAPEAEAAVVGVGAPREVAGTGLFAFGAVEEFAVVFLGDLGGDHVDGVVDQPA